MHIYSLEDFAAIHEGPEAGLHLQQRLIRQGSHWVRFVDVKRGLIEFGYVYYPHEFTELLAQRETPVEEIDDMLDTIEARYNVGYLFGPINSFLGERTGEVHRIQVWPIEPLVYREARHREWKVNQMSEAGLFSLQEAHHAYRGHVMSSRDKVQEG